MREPGKSKRPSVLRRFRSACASLGQDRDGSALFYTTISLPVLIGFALLAIDGSRIMNLHSSLQHAADALALTGAGELDRAPGACTRAELAMANLVENDQHFGDAGTATITIDDVSWRFLETIPANDADPILETMEVSPQDPCDANSAARARFIEVTIEPQNFTTFFPATFVGAASNTAATSAVAVAGFDLAVCKVQPLFMCNPFEPAGNTDIHRSIELFDHIADRAKRRRQIEFKKHAGGTAQWSPGNFGFLEADLGPGANALGQAIATVNPPACFIQNGVTTQTGSVAALNAAFNVRFDRYHGNYSANNPNYPPAPNVRKGYSPNSCPNNASPTEPPNMSLPRDACFNGGPCAVGDRIGMGDWDQNNDGVPEFGAYWTTNFGLTLPPADENGLLFSDTNLPTRYEIYMYEIENNLLGAPPLGATAEEHGAPYCHVNAASSNDPDRRIIHGALLNCLAVELGPGKEGPHVAVAFGRFFMTEPMDSVQDSLWVELADIVSAGQANDVARDLVQLYR
jgi:hypothetical protein